MSVYLLGLFISFLLNAILIVPFINFLYKMKFQRIAQKTRDVFNRRTPIFDKYNVNKTGVPVGGGILTVLTTVFLFAFLMLLFVLFNQPLRSNFPSIIAEIKIILSSFIGFALLGVFDDLSKIFFWQRNQFHGLRLRYKLSLEIILAVLVAWWLFFDLKINFIYIPFFGVFQLGWWYVPLAAFVIVAFANAVNITDGLDGLASGVMMISLISFWVISRSILDVPTSIFISAWLGGLIAFIYFNIPPARLILGDTGALSFGATFAVIGLALGKSISLTIIGGIFVVEIFTSLIQLLGKRFMKRKIFPVAPLHLWLQSRGWEESKIVMRFWIISILFAFFGLLIAFLK